MVVIYPITVTITVVESFVNSMYQVIKIYVCMWIGKNNNGLVYCKLINTTVLYLLTTVLYFYTAYLTFYGRYSTVFVFGFPMQSTVSIILNNYT